MTRLQIMRKRKLSIQQYLARKHQHFRSVILLFSFSDNIYNNVKFRASNCNSIKYPRRSLTSITLSTADKHEMNERSKQFQIKIVIALDQKNEKLKKS